MSNTEKVIILFLVLATVAVHTINLGLMPLHGDEAIRATVAFEMIQSKNYTVPTLFGEFYYRKPPLYNWVIAIFYKVFNSYSEFVFRLPSVLPLFVLGFSIWGIGRKQIGERTSVVAAFAFVLSGRLLTRDSMLGHIDILFSLVTFLGFYTVYYYHKSKQYWRLFIVSYLLAAAGVLMKGLPSFLFQGLTIGAWFLYKKELKKLVSIQHIAGILLFTLIVAGYFYSYSRYNPLENYFDALYNQAAMRTPTNHAWYVSVLNLITFPFENLGHLFPTSLLIFFALKKGVIKRWLKNDFTAFTLITLGVNIVPYWLSPGYYPRYLFMLYPLVFILVSEAYFRNENEQLILRKVVNSIFISAGFLIVIAIIASLFYSELAFINNVLVKQLVCVLIGVVIIYLWFKFKQYRIYWSFAFLILFRLGFDWFVIPHRVYREDSTDNYRKQQSKNLIEAAKGRRINVYKNVPLEYNYAYYLGAAQNSIVYKTDSISKNMLWITDQHQLKHFGEHKILYDFPSGYKDYHMYLIELE